MAQLSYIIASASKLCSSANVVAPESRIPATSIRHTRVARRAARNGCVTFVHRWRAISGSPTSTAHIIKSSHSGRSPDGSSASRALRYVP